MDDIPESAVPGRIEVVELCFTWPTDVPKADLVDVLAGLLAGLRGGGVSVCNNLLFAYGSAVAGLGISGRFGLRTGPDINEF